MYDSKPNLIIGFHGCDAKVSKALLNKPNIINKSEKPYDWLGHGMYFWENNYERALQWAKDKARRGEIDKPSVIGAVLNLGHCFDLVDSRFINMITYYYNLMDIEYALLGKELPKNRSLKEDLYNDNILRELDCAVIEYMHQEIIETVQKDKKEKGFSNYQLFDSSRGVFTEGGPAFPGAGIKSKSHIQICIRNTNCIKGFFLPRKEINFSL
jgi:hypothetical protein